jgi:tetratricopeptide (TPR) repeat protein
LALSQVLEDRFNIASALTGLGQVSQALGDIPDAQRFFEDSAQIWREIGDQGSLAQTLNQLGMALLVRADRPGAHRCFQEALEVAKEAQIIPVMLDALLGVAALHRRKGDTGSALELVLHILQNPACSQETPSLVLRHKSGSCAVRLSRWPTLGTSTRLWHQHALDTSMQA